MKFDHKLIDKARFYFYAVFVEPDRVRIYRKNWAYEEEHVFHNNAELEEYINVEESFQKDFFDFLSTEELKEFGLLYNDQ